MDLKEQHHKLDEAVIANLGDTDTETDFPNKYLTPTYDAYDDDMTEGTTVAPEKDLDPTPECGNKYVNAYVMLPREGTLSRVRIIERNRDDDGNTVGRANENTILDSLNYLVDFEYGEVTELASNMISESINSMCDPEGFGFYF